MVRRINLFFLSLFLAAPLTSMEIQVTGNLGDLYWSPTRTANTAGETFNGSDIYWNFDVSFAQEVFDGVKFRGGFETDPILRNRLFAELGMNLEHFVLQFTPYLGSLNTLQKWFNPGIEATVQYTFPGVAYIQGGFLTSFAPLSKIGDYYQTSQYASVGVTLENGIVSFEIRDKAYTEKKATGLDITDELTRYYLNTEMFLKNFPLRWSVGLGYQALTRSYVTSSAQVDTQLYSALIGLKLTWEISPNWTVFANLDSSLLTVGWGSTIYAVSDLGYLYQLQSGVKFKF